MTGLTALLASARYLLLDFDGPVYAELPAAEVASRLRQQLAAHGITLPGDGQPSDDPLDIFRQTSQLGPQVTAAIHQLLTGLEVQAIATARPTPGAAELIREARETGRGVLRSAHPVGARPARARPAGQPSQISEPHSKADSAGRPIFLGFYCPARDHRV